jgi:hypothetical protein
MGAPLPDALTKWRSYREGVARGMVRKKKPDRVWGHLRRTAGSEQRARHDRETSLNRQSER